MQKRDSGTRLRPVEHPERSCPNRFALCLSKSVCLQTSRSCFTTLTTPVVQTALQTLNLNIGFRKDLFLARHEVFHQKLAGRLLDRWNRDSHKPFPPQKRIRLCLRPAIWLWPSEIGLWIFSPIHWSRLFFFIPLTETKPCSC